MLKIWGLVFVIWVVYGNLQFHTCQSCLCDEFGAFCSGSGIRVEFFFLFS